MKVIYILCFVLCISLASAQGLLLVGKGGDLDNPTIVCGIAEFPSDTFDDIEFLYTRGAETYTTVLGEIPCSTFSGGCTKGDEFTCRAQGGEAAIGLRYTMVSDNSLIFPNTPPTRPEVMISPELPRDNNPLTCGLVTPVTDPDGDSITYYYAWFKKDRIDQSWSFQGQSIGGPAPQVPSVDTQPGEYWKCSIVADDGAGGLSLTEEVVVIQENTRGATIQEQGFISFGQLDHEIHQVHSGRFYYNGSFVRQQEEIQGNVDTLLVYQTTCNYGECGNVRVDKLISELTIAQVTSMSFDSGNAQDKDTYYPAALTNALYRPPQPALTQDMCFANLRDVPSVKSCLSYWPLTINANPGAIIEVESFACSDQYGNDVACAAERNEFFISSQTCDLQGISISPLPINRLGETAPVQIIGTYADGSSSPISEIVDIDTWPRNIVEFTDQGTLQFSQSGPLDFNATAVGVGQTYVTARAQEPGCPEVVAIEQVTITSPTLVCTYDTINILYNNSPLRTGDTYAITIEATSGASVTDVTTLFDISSLTPAVGEISGTVLSPIDRGNQTTFAQHKTLPECRAIRTDPVGIGSIIYGRLCAEMSPEEFVSNHYFAKNTEALVNTLPAENIGLCDDGIDNDGDGLADKDDWSCRVSGMRYEVDPTAVIGILERDAFNDLFEDFKTFARSADPIFIDDRIVISYAEQKNRADFVASPLYYYENLGPVSEADDLLKSQLVQIFNDPGVYTGQNDLGGHEAKLAACTPDPFDAHDCGPVWNTVCDGRGCCVYDGVCYGPGATGDFDGDSVDEVCNVNSPGVWTEPLTGAQNFCDNTNYVVCGEDGPSYSSGIDYTQSFTSKLYCAQLSGTTDWQWVVHNNTAEDLDTFDTYNTETCGDGNGEPTTFGINVDNNCNAFKSFLSTGTGYNYEIYVEDGNQFHVTKDVDAFDVACFGTVDVIVIDGDTGEQIQDADVKLSFINDLRIDQVYKERNTLTNGTDYVANFTGVPATTYKITASAPGFAGTAETIDLAYKGYQLVVISLQRSECTDTCVRQGTDLGNVCDIGCDGINGCFYTTEITFGGQPVKELLSGIPLGAEVEYLADDGTGNPVSYTVNACEGEPFPTPAPTIDSQIQCEDGEIAIVDTVVIYQGEPVTLTVVTCQ